MLQVPFLPTLQSLLVSPDVPLIHRDLSWIQFNERVLAEARSSSIPILERLKFLAITGSNLDEFFMIRFSSLRKTLVKAKNAEPEKVARLQKIYDEVLEAVAKFNIKQSETFDVLLSELEGQGIFFKNSEESSRAIFEAQVAPKLPPIEVVNAENLSRLENFQLAVISQETGKFLRIPKTVSGAISEYGMQNLASHSFFLLDELLLQNLKSILPNPCVVRVTRDGDFSVDLEEEDSESVPDVVATGIRRRDKGRPVRLQYYGPASPKFLEKISRMLRLRPFQVFPASGTVLLSALWSVLGQLSVQFSHLFYPVLANKMPKPFRKTNNLFERITKEDILLHHPYDSFDAFVSWIQAAADDPDVIMIEQTVYRMDAVSPVIKILKKAAQKKVVRVVIELRARFDELNNLKLADELRRAGVEVAFGFGRLKLHAKIALITRKEGKETRLYTHLSTGNYNAATARQYTDLAILTGNSEIGRDARYFFDKVWSAEVPVSFRKLLSAPARLHRKLLSLIEAETESARQGKKARIAAKVNALVDPAVIEKLYLASQAGVQVDLIVRGACSLVPGVPGLSEKIRVISVVDRFLEHSRIYFFQSSHELYLSSADWMPRNFFSRRELAFPVLDPFLYRFIVENIIGAFLNDTVKARELTPTGTWKKRTGTKSKAKPAIRSQWVFAELALNDYKGTPLE